MLVSEYIVMIPADPYGNEYVKICARNWDKSAIKSWAVVDKAGFVLRKSGGWAYEPNPSSRTEEFISDTRFDTAEEAYEALLRYDEETNDLKLSRD